MTFYALALVLAGILSFSDYITENFFSKQLRESKKIISFSGGVGISYVVLNLFPEISSYSLINGRAVFLYVLAGFVSLNLIEQFIYKEVKKINSYHKGVHITYFFVYKFLIGMVLASFASEGLTQTMLFFMPFLLYIIAEILPQEFDFKKHPAGQNITIAIMSYEGYNMSDAMILNKGSVERGLGRSTFFKPYSVEELRYSGGLKDDIIIPDKEVKGYKSERDYRYLEEDGIIYPEAKISEEEVMIGKVSPPRFLGELEEFSIAANIRRENSVTLKHGEAGIVDMVVVTENEEGNKLVQVRLREQRVPELGDKFASRHGQKGVVGLIVPQEDMPVTSSGITPDIIFSPHSIPSRMTISHMIEIVAGKVGSLSGNYIDGTTFDARSEKDIRQELLSLGFREDGTEIMYNGITGERYKTKIYVGNIYYLKLKHMVKNKLQSRASGKVQLLTRQPIEGRAKSGGIRLGEMEKDCLVAHGASLLLKERFDSDRTLLYVCENCGMIGMYDYFKSRKYCSKCGGNVEISGIEISYAFKLLLDELKSLCIYPKIILRSKY